MSGLKELAINELFDLNETIASPLLENHDFPWEVIPSIKDFILELGPLLDPERYNRLGDDIWIAKSAKVADSASLTGPLIIDEEAEIRQCAFIRGSAIVGRKSVVGNSTELKNVILFNNVEAPHYNYVGDSILGFHAHLGAGAITSNIKADRKNVVIKNGDEEIETGLRKIGAILGDYVEVGCNTVLNPGTIIGKETNVYPCSMVRGVIPAGHIYKNITTSSLVEKKN